MHRRPNPHAASPPDKGSFPLDHFQECEDLAEKYRLCLANVSGIPKKCKEEAKGYLECRMEKGLMAKHSMVELGFVEESTWEYEKLSREQLAQKVALIMKESRERVREDYMEKRKKERQKAKV